MIVYCSVLAIICADIFLRYAANNKIYGGKAKNVGIMLSAIVLIIVSGFRYNVGTDYKTYVINYDKYVSEPLSVFQQPALRVVARLSAIIFDDYATWFFIMAVITIAPIVYRIGKDSINPAFSVLLFLFLGCWHGSFNIVKQSAAMAILFLGYNAIVKRKFRDWLFICLAASLFHITALLMIPMYWLTANKITIKRIAFIFLLGILVLFLYEPLFELARWLKQEAGATSIDSSVGARSVNVLRILVNTAPVLFTFAFWHRYDKKDEQFAFLFNMALFNAVINISSMHSVYLNRFCVYTNIFNVLYIPYIVKPFKSRTKVLIMSLMCCLYFGFWIYDLSKGSTTVVYQWIFER